MKDEEDFGDEADDIEEESRMSERTKKLGEKSESFRENNPTYDTHSSFSMIIVLRLAN